MYSFDCQPKLRSSKYKYFNKTVTILAIFLQQTKQRFSSFLPTPFLSLRQHSVHDMNNGEFM